MGLFNRQYTYENRTLSYKKKTFKVEVADNFGKLSRGLMKHGKLLDGQGMLFVFKRDGRHGIWMLNMKFSIDVIWLDGDGKIITIAKDLPPCRSILNCPVYRPNGSARYVLELNSGTASKCGMKVGEKIIMR